MHAALVAAQPGRRGERRAAALARAREVADALVRAAVVRHHVALLCVRLPAPRFHARHRRSRRRRSRRRRSAAALEVLRLAVRP